MERDAGLLVSHLAHTVWQMTAPVFACFGNLSDKISEMHVNRNVLDKLCRTKTHHRSPPLPVTFLESKLCVLLIAWHQSFSTCSSCTSHLHLDKTC